MLKPEVKQKWLEALRSNQYPQGKEALRKTEIMSSDSVDMKLPIDCFCCLGVLCDISSVGKWTKINNESYCYDAAEDRGDDFPPIGVVNLVLNTEAQDINEEAIRVSELKDSSGFVQAFKKWKPHWTSRRILEDRVFVCLAIMNDSGASFEQIADVIEQYL